MCEIAEKLMLMNMRAVKVWTEAGTGSSPRFKIPYFRTSFLENGRGKVFSRPCNRIFGKVIDVLRSKSCFVTV